MASYNILVSDNFDSIKKIIVVPSNIFYLLDHLSCFTYGVLVYNFVNMDIIFKGKIIERISDIYDFDHFVDYYFNLNLGNEVQVIDLKKKNSL